MSETYYPRAPDDIDVDILRMKLESAEAECERLRAELVWAMERLQPIFEKAKMLEKLLPPKGAK